MSPKAKLASRTSDLVIPHIPFRAYCVPQGIYVYRFALTACQDLIGQLPVFYQPSLPVCQFLPLSCLLQAPVILDADEGGFGSTTGSEHDPLAAIGNAVDQLRNVAFHTTNAYVGIRHFVHSSEAVALF